MRTASISELLLCTQTQTRRLCQRNGLILNCFCLEFDSAADLAVVDVYQKEQKVKSVNQTLQIQN